ncbi:hypothetical protein OUZ56_010046 [Daphnia magna]|uniref:Uncharacterized protein n=1 Tax=Daphnia magna TaxID=35525 RepID=A0ABR0AHT5_9CRUS|nr:hypothetical protein OUZ56_010046 [Daphnia magna]
MESHLNKSVEPLPSRPESSDGVDGTNNPAETSDVDPTSATTRTGKEDSDIGATASNLTSIFTSHREERYLHLYSEVKELSIHSETLLLAYQQTFLVDIRNLILYLRELRLLTPLETLAPEINSLLRKLDNFPGANNPNNVQLAEKIHQTLSQTKT